MEMQENAILPYTNFTGAPANQIMSSENQPVTYPVEVGHATEMTESAVTRLSEPILQGADPMVQESAVEDHPAKNWFIPNVNVRMVESSLEGVDPVEIPYDISTEDQYLDANTLDQNTWDEAPIY